MLLGVCAYSVCGWYGPAAAAVNPCAQRTATTAHLCIGFAQAEIAFLNRKYVNSPPFGITGDVCSIRIITYDWLVGSR